MLFLFLFFLFYYHFYNCLYINHISSCAQHILDALNRWELQYFLDAKDLVVCISSTGLDNLVNE